MILVPELKTVVPHSGGFPVEGVVLEAGGGVVVDPDPPPPPPMDLRVHPTLALFELSLLTMMTDCDTG